MEGNREAVNLILDTLQQVELLAVACQRYRFSGISDQQLGRLMLIVLNQTADRNVEPQLILQYINRRGNLPFAAVHDNQIRLRQILLQHPFIPPPDNLTHRFIIIRSLHRADLVFTVFLACRLAVDEDDHS
ncbi:hypothetical protein D3C81_1942280 [compost metagenome]